MSISTSTETIRSIDADGNETITTVEKTRNIQRNNEPDYIKLYTRMWCEFTGIPTVYRELFIQLATRMTYCNTRDLGHSQLVNTGKPWSDDIMRVLGWKRRMYQKGLRALCDCGAIRQISRGVYQINPMYAGRGEWKYNPKLDRGGIEDLVATFNFRQGTVDTKIVWADDTTDSEINQIYRAGIHANAHDRSVIKETKRREMTELPGQMKITDLPGVLPLDPEVKELPF